MAAMGDSHTEVSGGSDTPIQTNATTKNSPNSQVLAPANRFPSAMRVKATGGTANSAVEGHRFHGRNQVTTPRLMAAVATTNTPARFMPGAGSATVARVTTPE